MRTILRYWIPGMIVFCSLLLFFSILNSNGSHTDGKAIEQEPPASLGHLRQPMLGEPQGYRTMPATQNPASSEVRYQIRAKNDADIEVGLARIATRYRGGGEYSFRVYERTEKGNTILFQTSEEFWPHRWNVFRIDRGVGASGDGTIEILYELKPRSIIAKLAAMIASRQGNHYYKDFAFLVPRALHERKHGEVNVILISFDTLRADHLGGLGYERPTTPNIDSFAQKGILLTQAISSAPWTVPAHFSLFTGLYPSAHLDRHDGYWGTRSLTKQTLANVLREHGYYTIAATGLPVQVGFGAGFDHYIEFPKNPKHESEDEKIFGSAMTWLEANRDIKFFMFIHTYTCHAPYENRQFLDQLDEPDFIEQRKALYDGDIRRVDTLFGRFMEKLEALGLLSHSLIILISDHGEELYDHFTEEDRNPPIPSPVPELSYVAHGHSVYDELIRIPVIFKLPTVRPPKNVLDNQIRLIDIMPTILDYLDIPAHGLNQGTSVLPLLKTGKRADDPAAISEFTCYGHEQKSVRMNGYKYIYTKDLMEKKMEIAFRNIPMYALFDLKNDPEEKTNIYHQNKELAEEYHRLLADTLRESRAINRELRSMQKHGTEKPETLSEDAIAGLKALGYLQ